MWRITFKILRFSKPALEKLYGRLEEWKKHSDMKEEIIVHVNGLKKAAESEGKPFRVSKLTVEYVDDEGLKIERLKAIKDEIQEFLEKYYLYFSTQKKKDTMVNIFLEESLERIKVALKGAELLHEIEKKITELTELVNDENGGAIAYWGMIKEDVPAFMAQLKNPGSDPNYPDMGNEISNITVNLKEMIIVSDNQDEVITEEQIRLMSK